MKKLFAVAVIIFVCNAVLPPAVLAQKHSKSKGAEKLQKIMVPDSSAEEMPIPDPAGLVSDFGNVFTPGQRDTLSAIINTFKDSTKDEIAIIAWDTLHLIPEDFPAYIKKIGDDWQLGEENKNNGIIIAFSAQLKRIRIHNVNGGLGEKDSYDIIHKIMSPYFANKSYYAGTLAALQAVIKKLNSE